MNVQAGYREGRSVSFRSVLASPEHVLFHHGMLDASECYDGKNVGFERELRPGTILGQITSSKLWVPCRRTTTSTTGTVTAIVVADARHFMAGDSITIGGDAGVAVSAVNYDTNTLTIASTTVASGEAVYVADGSQTARLILDNHVNLYTPDRVLVDQSFNRGIYHGVVKSALILGDLTAIRAATNYLSHIIWDDQQGMI